jgi:hypothetical protein
MQSSMFNSIDSVDLQTERIAAVKWAFTNTNSVVFLRGASLSFDVDIEPPSPVEILRTATTFVHVTK